MGESLYGKFGFDAVIIGFLILIITLFVSMGFGWLIPDLFNNLKVLLPLVLDYVLDESFVCRGIIPM